MSDEFDFDQENGQGPKALREALEKANKLIEQANKQNAEQAEKIRELQLGNIFRDKTVPAALQRLMKAEKVEATPESVDKWLADNGDDFGWKPGSAAEKPEGQESAPEEAPAAVQSVLTPEDVAAQQRIQAVSSNGVGQTTTSDAFENVLNGIEQQLGDDGTFEDALKLVKASGMFNIETELAH